MAERILKVTLKVPRHMLEIIDEGAHILLEIETRSKEITINMQSEHGEVETNRSLRAHIDEKQNKIIIGVN